MKIPSEIMEKVQKAGLVPEGDYELVINAVDARPTNKGNSYRIVIDFSIQSKKYPDSVVKTVFTVSNPDKPEAERISCMFFKKMLISSGLQENTPKEEFDTDILIGRKVKAHIVIDTANENYPACNRVKYFLNS